MGREKTLTPRKAVKTRRQFHHGFLAESATEAALEILEAEGAAALTMRRVAEACGVAHRSLYRHFADREALLGALAARGFEALVKTLALAETREDLIGLYARFALKRPDLYGVMMSRTNDAIDADPALRAAADRVIAESLRLLAPGEPNETQARRAVMKVWMALHGGVALYQAGMIKARNVAAFIGEMTAILDNSNCTHSVRNSHVDRRAD